MPIDDLLRDRSRQPWQLQAWARALQAAVIAAGLAGSAAAAADDELVAAVIVSRHGVRSPTATRPPLATLSPDPWPAWPGPPRFLPPPRARAARFLGAH